MQLFKMTKPNQQQASHALGKKINSIFEKYLLWLIKQQKPKHIYLLLMDQLLPLASVTEIEYTANIPDPLFTMLAPTT